MVIQRLGKYASKVAEHRLMQNNKSGRNNLCLSGCESTDPKLACNSIHVTITGRRSWCCFGPVSLCHPILKMYLPRMPMPLIS